MRLWHYKLIHLLPRQQLLGQHRECCALRGNGWGKKHATVNYVFNYCPTMLFDFHCRVMDEMENRGYKAGDEWRNPLYRGKNCNKLTPEQCIGVYKDKYPEHNTVYLNECIQNLRAKGIVFKPEELFNNSKLLMVDCMMGITIRGNINEG